MKVVDYWKCANKHLDFCEEILNSAISMPENRSMDFNNLINIYYMLGYIFEGFSICIAYSICYEKDGKEITWDMSKDVDFFDPEFTEVSGIAFTKNQKNREDASKISCTITSHQYNRIKQVIKDNLPCSTGSPIPYFQSDLEDANQFFLVDRWLPEYRYGYSDNPLAGLKNNSAKVRANGIKEKITKENLRGLIDTCRKIGRLIPAYFKHFK